MYFHGNRNKKEIALSFDDGPSGGTLEVLSLLKKYEIKATFFLVGKMIKDRENIVAQTKEDGHEFGNHTFSHERLWFKSKSFIKEELGRCDSELQRVGITTNLVRFPEFKFGLNALLVCRKLGKKIVFADVVPFKFKQSAFDWYEPWLRKKRGAQSPIDIQKVIKETIQNTRNGSILIFHDYLQGIGPNPELKLILERILPELKSRGFKFVTLSELLSSRT